MIQGIICFRQHAVIAKQKLVVFCWKLGWNNIIYCFMSVLCNLGTYDHIVYCHIQTQYVL